ncbi:Hypothetical predicted protein [Cloeon dipterum]|nr:Hypothetical predicted protein [Cloeon dipterum]
MCTVTPPLRPVRDVVVERPQAVPTRCAPLKPHWRGNLRWSCVEAGVGVRTAAAGPLLESHQELSEAANECDFTNRAPRTPHLPN